MGALPFSVIPHADESGLGWALRVSEENLLPSPWHLFALVGMTQSQMTVLSFDPVRLAAVTGVDAAMLKAMSCHEPGRRAARVPFRGHLIGRTRVRRLVPQVCLECIRVRGYARAIWDLVCVTACPQHRVRLVERHQACGKLLSWLRPGVNVCRCTMPLEGFSSVAASEGEIAVSALVECVLGRTCDPWTTYIGPTHELIERMVDLPLSYVLPAIGRMGGIMMDNRRRLDACNAQDIANAAGQAILHWPTALHDAMTRSATDPVLGTRAAARSRGVARGILHECEVFRAIARKHGVGEDPVERELLRYLGTQVGDVLLDGRLLKKLRRFGIEPSWISEGEAARRLGIHRKTLNRLVDNGDLVARRTEHLIPRVYVRAADLSPALKALRVVDFRSVVATTGLTAPVIRALRTSGEFPHTNRGARSDAFCVQDVAAFTRQWQAIPRTTKPGKCATMQLSQALRMPTGGSDIRWKAELVRLVLNGQLPVYATKTKPVLDATLARQDVLRIKSSCDRERQTLGDAATALRLTKLAVLRLIVDGQLQAEFDEPDIKIRRSTLQAFRERRSRLPTRAT
ncbi:MAG TPA: TniQ family protein [Albitalea sp.]|uniref:TniQ family protein n=1 Tax=Piscinibacter sp. TaxID=1903157 RepID=UPI002ED69862